MIAQELSKPSFSFPSPSFPFLSPLRPPAGRLRRRLFFFLFATGVKKTPGKAMFAQRLKQVSTQRQQVSTQQVSTRLLLDEGLPRTTRASHAVPCHPSRSSKKQQHARRDQPGHVRAGDNISARTRASVPRPASAARVHMADSGPVLACLERHQALAAWRRDSLHLCSTPCLAPASSARAAQRTRSQSVRPAVQAIVRQGGLVETSSGLGEASEGEESDDMLRRRARQQPRQRRRAWWRWQRRTRRRP